MKEVMAIIRMNKMNQTKRALADAGIASFTAHKVVGRGKGKVDYLLAVPSTEVARIQEAHIMLGHIICYLVEKELFGERSTP